MTTKELETMTLFYKRRNIHNSDNDRIRLWIKSLTLSNLLKYDDPYSGKCRKKFRMVIRREQPRGAQRALAYSYWVVHVRT